MLSSFKVKLNFLSKLFFKSDLPDFLYLGCFSINSIVFLRTSFNANDFYEKRVLCIRLSGIYKQTQLLTPPFKTCFNAFSKFFDSSLSSSSALHADKLLLPFDFLDLGFSSSSLLDSAFLFFSFN